jgi:aspartyl protease family protein
MSDGSQALNLVYLFLILVMVVSAFAVRRAPIGQTLKMALAWVLIFAAGFAVFALRDDFRALGNRIWVAVIGGPNQENVGSEVRVAMSEDGHFWVNAEINGQPTRMMIDSGATVTGLDRPTADRLGIVPDGRLARVQTANGAQVMDRGSASTIKVGSIERTDHSLLIARSETPNVIGMNFLSSLSHWSVEGRTLVLRP